jgi:hypothetical protein
MVKSNDFIFFKNLEKTKTKIISVKSLINYYRLYERLLPLLSINRDPPLNRYFYKFCSEGFEVNALLDCHPSHNCRPDASF